MSFDLQKQYQQSRLFKSRESDPNNLLDLLKKHDIGVDLNAHTHILCLFIYKNHEGMKGDPRSL